MPGFKTITFTVSALLAAAGTYAAPFQKRGLDNVIRQCKHNFAYTFDEGPYLWHTELVDKFDSVGAKTTFFVNGENFGCIYSDENVRSLRYGFERGHQYASLTWSNFNLTKLTEAQIDEEILRLDVAFVKILGVKPKLLRPSYGEIDERTASYIQSKHGKTIVLRDLDSGDTASGANEQRSIDFYNGLAAEGASSKHLTRSHEVWKYAVDAALNVTVKALHNADISLLTVAQCLDIDAYEHVGKYGERDATWTCEGPWTPPSTSGSSTPAPATPTPTPTTSGPSTLASTTPTPTHPVPSTSSSAPPTTTTPACEVTYVSVAKDDCTKIEAKYNLVRGTLKAANPFVTCNDIWIGTPLCIPDGPYNSTPTRSSAPPTTTTPACRETYVSAAGDDCTKIEIKYNLVRGTLKAANPFVTCNDIWTETPLCIPDGPYNPTPTSSSIPAITSPVCKQTYTSVLKDTCASIEIKYNLMAGTIKAANPFLTCTDIWTWTPICVPDGPYAIGGGADLILS